MRARVTFLLTEVVDSVRRWEDDDLAMAEATARLDDIVRRLVTEHRGVLVKPRGEGDSHFLTFDDPIDAVTCAVALQRSVANEPTLALRSACNIGEADLRDGDWYGTTVNRCARLRAAAQGRQALVSAEVAAAVGAIAGVSLHSLGYHRLKDLDEAVEVFQLGAEGLVVDHPPLGTIARTHGLPVPGSSFVGRKADVEHILSVVAEGGVATVVGAPGVGTTRLALEAAAAWWERDGRPVGWSTDPAGWDVVAAARGASGGVVVVDGADRLAFTDEPVVGPLVMTSRGPLGLAGEVIVRVSPLDDVDAEHLLRDRLRTDTDVAAGLVAWTDGLPLAIELLARRAASVDPATLAARLAADPLAVLGGDRRAEPARHASVRATLQAAFDVLGLDDRADLLAARAGHPRWVAAGWHEHRGPLPLIARFLAERSGSHDPAPTR